MQTKTETKPTNGLPLLIGTAATGSSVAGFVAYLIHNENDTGTFVIWLAFSLTFAAIMLYEQKAGISHSMQTARNLILLIIALFVMNAYVF